MIALSGLQVANILMDLLCNENSFPCDIESMDEMYG